MATEQIPENYGQWTAIYNYTGSARQFAVTCGYANLAESDPEASANKVFTAGTSGTNGIFDAVNMANTMTLAAIYCLQMRDGVLESNLLSVDAAGSRTGNPAPLNTTVVVAKTTRRAGRQFRGRMLLPGGYLDQDDVTGLGTINGTPGASLQGMVDDFWTALTDAFIPPVLLHSQPKNPSAPIPAPTPVSAFEVRIQTGTDRRRMKRTSVSFVS